jgi:UDP-N-acetylglucosamine acyltransferase
MSDPPAASWRWTWAGEGRIHPSAVIAPGAQIDLAATVGPYAVIGPRVVIGPQTEIGPHSLIEGNTRLGARNRVGPHTVLGAPPQVRECSDGGGRLVIGDDNWIREFATVHAARPGGETRIGSNNFLMAGSHVAHDCILGDHVELANDVQLAGHVRVEDHVGLGGLAAVHQFVSLGAHSFVGAGSMVSQDVLPFTLVSGDRARTFGLNVVGLRRHNFPAALCRDLARAVRMILEAGILAEGVARVRSEIPPSDPVERLLSFVSASQRGLCRSVSRARGAGEER